MESIDESLLAAYREEDVIFSLFLAEDSIFEDHNSCYYCGKSSCKIKEKLMPLYLIAGCPTVKTDAYILVDLEEEIIEWFWGNVKIYEVRKGTLTSYFENIENEQIDDRVLEACNEIADETKEMIFAGEFFTDRANFLNHGVRIKQLESEHV